MPNLQLGIVNVSTTDAQLLSIDCPVYCTTTSDRGEERQVCWREEGMLGREAGSRGPLGWGWLSCLHDCRCALGLLF